MNNVKKLLNDIDKANTSNEIKDIVKANYSAKEPRDTIKYIKKIFLTKISKEYLKSVLF